MAKIIGLIIGFITADRFLHVLKAHAIDFEATTTNERIGAVLFGVVILLVIMAAIRRFLSRSFFHGFVVATGLFLSFDIVVYHWIFKLHRITNGPEADIIEPILVVVGTCFFIFGLYKEKV